ncbi:hypothetical protein DSL72_009470 [Monilinia vaccinii-corymbosi]|uniref:Endonuclease/exonuclease/phosphatase domain-containing protein n=1 Tax=Monilinia vaccinii-corymbosi TaxID=61207 RepID=A0A8A3PPE8_9HELO|nr:hypothetical protein DSL72_009470 [Monilinia vaccinii-corymbosi]
MAPQTPDQPTAKGTNTHTRNQPTKTLFVFQFTGVLQDITPIPPKPNTHPKTRTQNHPVYKYYTLINTWERVELAEQEAERPRAMLYTQQAAGLAIQQRQDSNDRDFVWLEVNSYHVVNVYRESDTSQMIEYVTGLQIPLNFLIGRDFNTKHNTFEPRVGFFNQGTALAEWTHNSRADYIGKPGELIHRAGHIIDLTFSNIPFAETRVKHNLNYGSDHYILITTIPAKGLGAEGNAGYRVTKASFARPEQHRGTPSYSVLECNQGNRKVLVRHGQDGALVDTSVRGGTRELHQGAQALRTGSQTEKIEDAHSNQTSQAQLLAQGDRQRGRQRGSAPSLVVDDRSIEGTKEKTEILLEKILYQMTSVFLINDEDIVRRDKEKCNKRSKHSIRHRPCHCPAPQSLLAAHQAVPKEPLPEMLQANTLPNRIEASRGSDTTKDRKEEQIVDPLLEAHRAPILHRQKPGTPGCQKDLVGGYTPQGH